MDPSAAYNELEFGSSDNEMELTSMMLTANNAPGFEGIDETMDEEIGLVSLPGSCDPAFDKRGASTFQHSPDEENRNTMLVEDFGNASLAPSSFPVDSNYEIAEEFVEPRSFAAKMNVARRAKSPTRPLTPTRPMNPKRPTSPMAPTRPQTPPRSKTPTRPKTPKRAAQRRSLRIANQQKKGKPLSPASSFTSIAARHKLNQTSRSRKTRKQTPEQRKRQRKMKKPVQKALGQRAGPRKTKKTARTTKRVQRKR